MDLELGVIAAAGAPAAPGLKKTLLDHALEALPLDRAAAEPRRDLVDGEHEEVHQPAGAAAGHGGAPCGGLAGHLGETGTCRVVDGEQWLPAIQGRWADDELPSHAGK